MRDYLEHLRAKPEPTRRAIALSVAVAVTAVVAVGWAVAFVSSGKLSLDAVPTDSAFESTFAEGEERFNALAGAAAAFGGTAEAEPSVTIVEENSESTLDRNTVEAEEATVIHF